MKKVLKIGGIVLSAISVAIIALFAALVYYDDEILDDI